MRRTKIYPTLTKQIFYPEIRTCLTCGSRLRRYTTVSERTVITLNGPLRVVHYGCRCPNPACASRNRSVVSFFVDMILFAPFNGVGRNAEGVMNQ